MTLEELKSFFRSDARCQQLIHGLENRAEPRLQLEGLQGSGISFIAETVYQELNGTHLMLFSDKEKAAYYYNDMQDLIGKDRIFFFPASYRYPYNEEQTDNMNVLMRAEVLEMLSKKHSKCVVVSYAEALSEKVVTKKNLRKNTLGIKVGDEVSQDFY